MANLRHVLIIDDDELLRAALTAMLADAGYSTAVAENGREAMAYIRSRQPDAVILDVFMPEMDGLEVLRHIKREFPRIRTVVVSGGGSARFWDVLRIATELGADSVLQKPFSCEKLLAGLKGES